MRFAETFGIKNAKRNDWFDVDLTVDTKLFVDPFLMLRAGEGWPQAHADLVAHFAHCYELVAKAPHEQSLSAKQARRLLTFPEPAEFCLGYTSASTKGSGGGAGRAVAIADGIAVAIAAGLKHPEHIEEIGILNERFGADSISDATLNILKAHFIRYTQTIAGDHGVPLEPHQLRNASVDLEHSRWESDAVDLPTNPSTGGPVLLVPKRLLRNLPTLNAEDWFQSDLNDELRTSLNVSIGKTLPKARIVQEARKNPKAVREWARRQQSRPDLFSYDFEEDPLGVVSYDEAGEYAAKHPIGLHHVPVTQDDLSYLMGEVLKRFKDFVEQGGGWSLLWDSEGREKPEEAAQLLFMGMSRAYLRQAGVELDREVELGRGPVDFKASSGANARLLVEIKKVHNGKFWNGLRDQLPSYLTSDDTKEGWFVAIQYREAKSSMDRVAQLPTEVKQAAAVTGRDLRFMAVDARRPLSASKIKGG
ncbi:hypothetical protein [Micrococcus lacusdianchii]|uniref:hypothetical protein n=1 Tax=Micrococcus lacusdianchii TaxID=2915940 RepID=UPI0020063242|nr:hypothetical protein [Micrococcus sp. JXJ CY 30]